MVLQEVQIGILAITCHLMKYCILVLVVQYCELKKWNKSEQVSMSPRPPVKFRAQYHWLIWNFFSSSSTAKNSHFIQSKCIDLILLFFIHISPQQFAHSFSITAELLLPQSLSEKCL